MVRKFIKKTTAVLLCAAVAALSGAVLYQRIVLQAQMRQSLEEMTAVLGRVLDGESGEQVMVFTQDQALTGLIAQINRLLEERQRRRAEYRRTEQAVRRMLANISHDIRTPMTVVLGYLEIMRLRKECREELLEKVEARAGEVMELMDRFFTLAKLEAGDMELERSRVDVGEVCRETVLDFYQILTRQEIRVEAEIPEGAVWGCCDREALRRIGVSSVTVVPEQEQPDGRFPTAPYPNPEIREAFGCALKLAEREEPDLLLATDPDCDRVGIAVKDGDDYTLMTGNEVGCLLLDYILSCRAAAGTLPADPVVVKTIVTSDLAARIAEKYGCQLVEVLTGFKYIGEQIGLLEKEGHPERYVFGFEESYGYLSGSYVRDKDGVVASMLVCEMAAYYKEKGLSLLDVLNSLYREHGVYRHSLVNAEFEGAQGMIAMQNLMDSLRNNHPAAIAGLKVVKVSDYLLSVKKDLATGREEAIDLPKSNVLAFALEGNAGLVVRPSGTEPKVKAYVTATGTDAAAAAAMADRLTAAAKELLK